MEQKEELKRIAEACESHILCIDILDYSDEQFDDWDIGESDRYEDIGDWISDVVLDIHREQYYSGGEWVTTFYTLVTTIGGPHVEFTSRGEISVYWGGDSYQYHPCRDCLQIMEQIGDYLDEIYE